MRNKSELIEDNESLTESVRLLTHTVNQQNATIQMMDSDVSGNIMLIGQLRATIRSLEGELSITKAILKDKERELEVWHAYENGVDTMQKARLDLIKVTLMDLKKRHPMEEDLGALIRVVMMLTDEVKEEEDQ